MSALTSITTFTAVPSVAAHAVATGYAVTTCSSGPPITSGCTDTARPSFPALASIGGEGVQVGIAIYNVNINIARVHTRPARPSITGIYAWRSRAASSSWGAGRILARET